MESYCIIGNWLGINLESFKQFTLNQCCKWSNLYKDHLRNYVQSNLNVNIFAPVKYLYLRVSVFVKIAFQLLESFISDSCRILETQFARDDINILLKVMFVLNEIDARNVHVQDLFDPLKKVVDFLLVYGVSLPQHFSSQVSACDSNKYST